MRVRVSLLLLALALAASSAVTSQASVCSNSTPSRQLRLYHPRVRFIQGRAPMLIDGLAKAAFDGKGNDNRAGDAVADNGNLAPDLVSEHGYLLREPRLHRNRNQRRPSHG